MITRLQWQPIVLRFQHRVDAIRSAWIERNIVLLRVSDNNGTFGIGEAAPLPDWGTETLAETVKGVNDLQPFIKEIPFPDELESVPEFMSALDTVLDFRPALRFALESAVLDRIGNFLKLPVGMLLNSELNTIIPVTQLLSNTDQNVLETVDSYRHLGYRTFKLKTSTDFLSDYKKLTELIKSFPDTQFRFDINGSWTLEDAIDRTIRLADLRIEYIEQPVADYDIELFLNRIRDVPVSIALDESVSSETQCRKWITIHPNVSFVLKPMTLGGILRSRDLALLAEQNEIKAVFSSSMDSGIAAAAYFHLAASLPNNHFAHGISTNRLLESDTIADHHVQRGVIVFDPISNGMGFQMKSSIDFSWKRINDVSA